MIKMDSIISCIILCFLISYADAICGQQTAYAIAETALNGTNIFNGTKTQGDTVTFRVRFPSSTKDPTGFTNNIKSALLLFINYMYTTFRLENTKPLDLEEFWISYEVDIKTITLTETCGGNTGDVFISVTPVNEFAPVFTNSPYNITLLESTRVGSVVYKLKPKVQDADVGGVHNFDFKIHPYSLTDHDGSAFFSIPSSSTGNITLRKALDFYTTEKNIRFLNLSVADGQSADAKTAQTTLQIHVKDVDDQVPYFEYPNCPAPCPIPAFESVTRLAYTGPLDITPPLRGKDDDTLGTSLLYSIVAGNEKTLFIIDVSTGALTQITAVSEANLTETSFRLVIKVKKDLQNTDLSSIAVLDVKVLERLPNKNDQKNGSTIYHSSVGDDVYAYKTASIVLGIAFASVSSVLAVLAVKYLYQRKAKQTIETVPNINYQY